jgi:hypothetical protein
MHSRLNDAVVPDLASGAQLAYLSMLENAPFGICIVDKDFRLALLSEGARKTFSVVPDAVGRDLTEVLRAIWPEPFVSEALGRFRHTLATGESYHAPGTVQQRAGNANTEAYDWKLDRVLLSDGEPGVICYFHDLTGRELAQQQLREAEVNKGFLLELSDALRPLADPARLEGTACALMARHLGVDRGKKDLFELAMSMLRVWPTIMDKAAEASSPFLYTVRYGGRKLKMYSAE